MDKILIKTSLFFLAVLGLVLGLNFLIYKISVTKAGASENLCGYAWSENIGWISFNSTNCDADDNGFSDGASAGCPAAGTPISSYGANLDLNNGKVSGYAWSENIGWISFNESDTGAPPSDDPCSDASCIAKATPPGQLGVSSVNIYGWARALAACDSVPCTSAGPGSNSGGWDGWIRFDHDQSGEVYIDITNKFHNWAWDSTGSDIGIGWLSFNSDEGGGETYAVGLSCSCGTWTEQGCGEGGCDIDKRFQTRTCDPSGCLSEEDCVFDSACTHKECVTEQCVEVAGGGADQCSDDNECVSKPWWEWKWWEVIPKD